MPHACGYRNGTFCITSNACHSLFHSYLLLFCWVTINQLFSVINVCFEMVLGLQCHVIRYRSNWSNKGEVSVGTKEPVKCLKSEPFLKSFALIIRVDNTFICNIKTILTFWVYTKKINFVYIVIRYWRPNCKCILGPHYIVLLTVSCYL